MQAVEVDPDSSARNPEHGVVVECVESVVERVIRRSLNRDRLADHNRKRDGAASERVKADDVGEVHCATVGGVLESGQKADAVFVGFYRGGVVVTGTTCKTERDSLTRFLL